MTEQADRIEAKMDRLIELLEADAVKRTRKVKPFISKEERSGLHQQYGQVFNGDLMAIDACINSALDHDAGKKRGNSGSWVLYVQGWLRDEAEKQPKFSKPIVNPGDSEEEKWRRNAEQIKERGLSR